MVLHLPRTLLARTEMAARQEDGIDLALPADVAEVIFLICMLELHRSLAETFPLLEPASVDVAMFDVLHATLTIGLVSGPVTLVAVPICVLHCASTTFFPRNKIAVISIASRSNHDSVAVSPAAFEGMGPVAGAEIGAIRFVAEV